MKVAGGKGGGSYTVKSMKLTHAVEIIIHSYSRWLPLQLNEDTVLSKQDDKILQKSDEFNFSHLIHLFLSFYICFKVEQLLL